MSPHPSDQYLERSHVSTTALQCFDDVEIKRWLTEWQCHLSWTKKWAFFCRWWDYCLLQEHKDDSHSKKGIIPCSDKRKKWLHSAAGGKEQGAKSQGVGPGTQGKYIESKANNFHHRSSFKYKIVIFIPYVSSGPVLLIGPESRMP